MINVSFPEAMRSGNSIAPAFGYFEINKAPKQVKFTFNKVGGKQWFVSLAGVIHRAQNRGPGVDKWPGNDLPDAR